MRICGDITIDGQATVYARIVQLATDYTVQVEGCNCLFVVNSTDNCTVTLPSNAPIGFQLLVMSENSGLVVIEPPSGETLNEANGNTKISRAYAAVTIIKYHATKWFMQG